MKKRRTSEDLCLLCCERKATKRNAHIVSKFFANSFLTNFKGHKMSKDGVKKNVVQDSPKENYLFCPQCESFLGFIETEISPYLTHYHETKLSNDEKEVGLNKLISKQCVELDERLFHLFFYSLIFRASVSNNEVFAVFNLTEPRIEELRIAIMDYYSKTGTEFKQKLLEVDFRMVIKYVLFTCVNFPDDSACGITGSSTDKFHILVLNKFSMFITEKETGYFFDYLWNSESKNKLITLLRFETWKKLFIDLPFKLMIEN